MENAGQTLNLPAVEAYLQERIQDFEGPLDAKKFETGQSNPTFLLITPKRKYVLRRKPPGELLKSAHAVDREFRVQKALQGSDVPVAKMHLLCEDDAVIGSMFYVMDHVDGRNFNDPRLPDLNRDHRIAVFDDMNRVLAALHDIDLEATGLSDFGRPGNYFERQIGRWSKQYKLSETEPLPDMDRLIEALQEGLPDDDGMHGLVHGDYRLDNLIFDHDARRCLAVLDWELSTTGHPFADLAYVIMQWQMPVGDDSRGLEGVDRAELGIPSDEAFIAHYCERRGLSGIPNFAFYLAFCFFRMAAILQGVKKRALEGNASNPEKALKLGAQVPNFAARGLKAFDNG